MPSGAQTIPTRNIIAGTLDIKCPTRKAGVLHNTPHTWKPHNPHLSLHTFLTFRYTLSSPFAAHFPHLSLHTFLTFRCTFFTFRCTLFSPFAAHFSHLSLHFLHLSLRTFLSHRHNIIPTSNSISLSICHSSTC
ncbi:hypothetical protein BsWGS_22058 [Bradybaena similaris]